MQTAWIRMRRRVTHLDPTCLTLGQWFYQRSRECVKYKPEVEQLLRMCLTCLAVKRLTEIEIARFDIVVLVLQNFEDLSFAERKAIVARRCRDVKAWPKHRDEAGATAGATVFIDKEYELVACNNHKVGSSTVTRILYKLKNITNIHERRWRGRNLSNTVNANQINSLPYTRFMFVRDPLERLLSAYTDNRGVPSIKGKKVSFEKFLTMILNRPKADTHHMLYYSRCRPCDVHYDFFGTMDTYNDDLTYIFQRLHIPVDSIPRVKGRKMTSYTSDERLINLPLLIKSTVWQHFKEDYYIFGYLDPAVKYQARYKNHTDSSSKAVE